MVKPEFFDSESLGACSIQARLAFIGLWVTGDDYGNQKAQLSRLKMKIFPYDTMTESEFLGYLCELEDVGCIKGYVIDGERYITVPNFSTYQTVRKPSKSSIPEPPKETQKARKTKVFREWKTGAKPVENNTSTSLVRHQCATSDPKERKKEGSNRVLTHSIANEYEQAGAVAGKPAPAPARCLLCGDELTRTGMKNPAEFWFCSTCKDFYPEDMQRLLPERESECINGNRT